LQLPQPAKIDAVREDGYGKVEVTVAVKLLALSRKVTVKDKLGEEITLKRSRRGQR
jgi:hypothetical protein